MSRLIALLGAFMLATLAVVLVPAFAMAEEAGGSLSSLFSSDILPALVEFAGVVLMAALTWGAYRLAKLFGLQITASQDAMLRMGIRKLIQWAEEKIPSGGKELAVIDRAEQVLGVTRTQAKDLVEQEIGDLAHLGIGKLGKRVQAATGKPEASH